MGAEFAVGTGVTGIPCKLLGGDAHHALIAEVGGLVHIKIPVVDGQHHEDEFRHDDGTLDRVGDRLGLDALVVRLGIVGGAKLP